MQLLIVACRQDKFAYHFSKYCQNKQVDTVCLEPTAAASLLSVEIIGKKAKVSPSVPILLRGGSSVGDQASFDEEFLTSEINAMLWSAASLTDSIVINRPSPHGYWGKLVETMSVSEHRVGAPKRSEIFTSRLTSKNDWAGFWAVNAVSNNRFVCGHLHTDTHAPHRLRPGVQQPGYEQVWVVGNNGWRSSSAPIEHLDAEASSIDYATKLGLQFACFTWIVSKDLQSKTLANIDPWPQIPTQASLQETIFNALHKELLS